MRWTVFRSECLVFVQGAHQLGNPFSFSIVQQTRSPLHRALCLGQFHTVVIKNWNNYPADWHRSATNVKNMRNLSKTNRRSMPLMKKVDRFALYFIANRSTQLFFNKSPPRVRITNFPCHFMQKKKTIAPHNQTLYTQFNIHFCDFQISLDIIVQ